VFFFLCVFLFVFEKKEKDLNDHCDKDCKFSPRVNWSSVKYVGEVHKFCFCSECSRPMVDPVTVSACEHSFCCACVESFSQCPLCGQTSMTLERADKTLRALLGELNVECEKCPWKGHRFQLEEHVKLECKGFSKQEVYTFQDVDTE
jgi:hypothetical protein